jgi:RimJ/RimL family protein N-acetyltransferase
MFRIAQWQADIEISKLNPTVERVIHVLSLSIYDGDEHIGVITSYNACGDSIEVGIQIGVKEKWGQGHGSRAIETFLGILSNQGVNHVCLKVLPHNKHAIHCYERCGFCAGRLFELNGYVFLSMDKYIGKSES